MFLKSFDFSSPMENVIEWNRIARQGKHDFSQDTIDFQIELVEEETKELEESLENKDKILMLDALCDMFVTGAYWYFLENKATHTGFSIPAPLKGMDYILASQYDLKNRSSFMFLTSVCTMLYMFNGNSEEALNEVLRSNDSKYPLVSSYTITPEDECKWIENKYKGKHENVTYKITKDKEGHQHYVFFNDKGKIVKPSNFVEPNLRPYI